MKTGVNMIETASAHFGSGAARASFERLARAGARVVALVPFFWQSHPGDPALVRGAALPAERLRLGMAEAARVGLEVVVKVLRPGIHERVARDVALLHFLAGLAERLRPELSRRLRPREVEAEYEKVITDELDLPR